MLPRGDAEPDLWTEALAAQPDAFDEATLLAWFRERASFADPQWVQGRLTADTVNDPERRHYPHPRDLLFRRADGLLERYVLSRHGAWSAGGLPTLLPMAGLVEDRAKAEADADAVWFARRAG